MLYARSLLPLAIAAAYTPAGNTNEKYIDSYAGTTTATLGPHQVGDIFVAWSIRDGSSTAPSLASGWTDITNSGSNSLGYRLAYKVAASTGETAGTWANATSLIIDHYRPPSGYSVSIGATATSGSSSATNLTCPALTLQNTDGTSLVLAYFGHRSSDITNLDTAPSGMVNSDVELDGSVDAAASYRTATEVSSWSAQSVTFGGSASTARWVVAELKFTLGTPVNVPTSLAASVTGSDITISWTDTNSGLAQTRIDTSTDNSTWSLLTTKAAGTNSHTITSASPGTTYYRVRAEIGASTSSYTSSVSATVSGSGWQLASGHYETAKIPLEIIAPRAGLNTNNRYYKAYPSLLYRVPVVVLGGAWPFRYELTASPSGMTIGETYGSTNYGVIEWSNPTTSGSPHTVTVRVTDQAGTVTTVTYTITVTTTGYLFIDATNGNNANAGTLASPKQTINGWFNSAKTDSTYANYHVIYRSGTYNTSAAPIEDSVRMACTSDRKPKVHYAYPGEDVIIDTTGSHWINYSNPTGNYYWGGLRFEGIGASNSEKCIAWDSGSGVDNIVLFENEFAQSPTGTTGQNPSVLFSANGGSISQYIGIVGNSFEGTDNYMMFLGYYCNKGVIENNAVQNGDGNGFYLKMNFQYWSIRNNRGLTGNSNHLVAVDTYSTADDIEVCWNNYKTTGYGIATNQSGALGEMWDYRNTWQIDSNIAQNNAGGNWYATRNVVRYASGTQGYATSGSTVTITRTELLAATSGLIDTSTGLLTGADRTNYLGIRGHEVS